MQPVEQLGGIIGLALEQDSAIHRNAHDQRSDVIFADVVAELDEDGIGIIQKLRSHPDGEKLPNFFFWRHRAQCLVDPLLSGFVDVNGTGLHEAVFVLVFRKAQRHSK